MARNDNYNMDKDIANQLEDAGWELNGTNLNRDGEREYKPDIHDLLREKYLVNHTPYAQHGYNHDNLDSLDEFERSKYQEGIEKSYLNLSTWAGVHGFSEGELKDGEYLYKTPQYKTLMKQAREILKENSIVLPGDADNLVQCYLTGHRGDLYLSAIGGIYNTKGYQEFKTRLLNSEWKKGGADENGKTYLLDRWNDPIFPNTKDQWTDNSFSDHYRMRDIIKELGISPEKAWEYTKAFESDNIDTNRRKIQQLDLYGNLAPHTFNSLHAELKKYPQYQNATDAFSTLDKVLMAYYEANPDSKNDSRFDDNLIKFGAVPDN